MSRHNVFQRRWKKFKRFSTRKKVATVGLASAVFLLLVPVATYAYYARDIADPERLMNRNSTGIALLDRNGEVFYSFGRTHQKEKLKLDQISDNLETALIASEDQEFYGHAGYSVRGMVAALYANILNKDPTRYGGSTITQQLVKNNLLSANKSFLRKYQEVAIAVAVDRRYSKQEILEMYLNSVYFGEGAFGVNQAAKTYFNKPAADLSLAESSMLIGILPAPSAYSPLSGDQQKAKQHQERVLRQMIGAGYINEAQKDSAIAEVLTYERPETAPATRAQHFALMVLDELEERYGEEKITRSGYRVTTGLDLGWQKTAEEQVRRRVAQLKSSGGTNAALVAIDAKTGEVRALVGSTDWYDQEFGKVNMATSPRQPGSSFKPIYFTEALDKKIITAATILKDEPRSWGSYRPRNYDFRYLGDIPTRKALAQSRNLTAIEVMEKLGVDDAAKAARRLGITTVDEPRKYGLSLALGTAETKLLDMTNAYAAFANEGRQHTPTLITSIDDKFNKKVYQYRPKDRKVMSREASFLVSSILSDTNARGSTFASLNIPGRQVAAKTGTTNDNKDAWTLGYSPSLSVGVWVGNNANKSMSGVAGASGAGPVWRNSITAFLKGTKAEEFKVPSGIRQISVCVNGGRADRDGAGTYREYFIRGTEPSFRCTVQKQDKEEDKKPEEDKEDKKEEPPKEEEPPREDEGPPIEDPPTEPLPPPPQE